MPETKALTTINVEEIQLHNNKVLDLLKDAMTEGLDYGNIPGTKGKSLFAAGADKLAKFIKVAPEYETEAAIENFEEGFFYYRVKCKLLDYGTNMIVGGAVKVCHSKELKYRKLSKYQLLDKTNAILSMAEKRAFVAAVKTCGLAREIFKETYEVDELTGDVLAEEADEDETSIALKRLFTMAGERGFSSDEVKKLAKAKFGVQSMTELTITQIEAVMKFYVDTFKEVGRGNRAERIVPKTDEPTVAKPADNPTVVAGTITRHDGESFAEPAEGKKCLRCKQIKDASEFHGGFCNECFAQLPQNQHQEEAV